METSSNKNKQRHGVFLLHYELLTRGMLSSKKLPIMPALCSKLAYFAGIMLDALACLLCLKLCQHNRCMPTWLKIEKQVDVLPSKNQALCDLIYNVIING